jgi:hypothetical protein
MMNVFIFIKNEFFLLPCEQFLTPDIWESFAEMLKIRQMILGIMMTSHLPEGGAGADNDDEEGHAIEQVEGVQYNP